MPPARSASASTSRNTTQPPPPLPQSRSRGNHHAAEADEDEEWDNNGGDDDGEEQRRQPVKRAKTVTTADGKAGRTAASGSKGTAAPRSKQRPQQQQQSDDLEMLSDEEVPADDVKALQEQLRAMREANEALAKQFDELRSLRNTRAEADLAAYKEASESSQRHSKELVASLKTRLEQAEKRANSKAAAEDASEDGGGSSAQNVKLKAEVDRLRKERNAAQDSADRLGQELKSARRQQQSKSSTSERLLDVEREAIRKLYEDLTGITIQRVEECEPHDDEPQSSDGVVQRRFRAFFAAFSHYDLQFDFEEASSTLPAAADGIRQDLIFTPRLDAERDAELLENSSLPRHLRDQIRFDRANSVKFLGSLTRGLRKEGSRGR